MLKVSVSPIRAVSRAQKDGSFLCVSLSFTRQWMRLRTAYCIAVGPCNAENVLGSIPLLRAAFSPQEAALFLGRVTVRRFA